MSGINGLVVMVVSEQPVVVLGPVFDLLEKVRQVIRHVVPGELEGDAGWGAVGKDNGVLCSVTGFPSIVVPAGFVPSEDAPIGVPVGMEIIGRPFSEPVLIQLAYAFEQASKLRRPPQSTPPISCM